ncbi:peptidoglycan-binding protein [Streptomyces sp. NPDC058442]|uniref:peptidoglycan-binding protein n=1 Tax=Streptomyces sp. NPDC058442 TaxID=3346503 RepID=UPI00364AB074
MESPVFEEFEPAGDCGCPGCVHRRRVLAYAPAGGSVGHPVAFRPLVVAAAASAVVAAQAAPALAAPHTAERPGAPGVPGVPAGDEPATPQGPRAPLYGPAGRPADPADPSIPTTSRAISRTDIIERARKWVDRKVPYSVSAFWSDGYRQDCSGYVSMAWNLPGNEWTGSLGQYAERIGKDELQPGDVLLFHNASDPYGGSHVVLFGGWTDGARTTYVAYEQTPPNTLRRTTPYAYWNNSAGYVPYRYKGVTDGTVRAEGAGAAAQARTPFPGVAHFGPGANNPHVTELGRLLVERGGARFYATGPGPRWTDTDRAAIRAFQQAQGWQGSAADGLPGPLTWELLLTGGGRDIPAAEDAQDAHGVPGYPGRAAFRPGAVDGQVTRLGRQLVRKGFGRHYVTGPGPRWSEADRRNVEDFQRAQGWRGGAADGLPGPETWRRLFS